VTKPGEILLEDVHKTFRLYHQTTVKSTILHLARGERIFERRPILKGVGLKVGAGERVGLIGRNGAGKSTLFRLMSRILRPDRGTLEVGGRVSPLIQLTAGLVPDLTGAENIRLNAAVLGLGRRVIEERFDDVVRFSELQEFIDTPVRYYSSGMKARLGFAVAVHADADVLLIDEALSVGDQSFQRRCIDRMKDLTETGATVVFVSHNFSLVGQFCDRVVWLDDGKVRADGPAGDVLPVAMDEMGGRPSALAPGAPS
jgi:ABC-type polysaccharide/polyol phosphate transport system ATPase subunit